MKNLNDPIIRDAEKAPDDGLSPMDAPEARKPPAGLDPIEREELAPFLRELWDEHDAFVEQLQAFDTALSSIRENGITREANAAVRDFFRHFDTEFMPHHRKEERHLFPLLEKALVESGEHSTGPEQHTSVGLMEDDHVEALQLAAVVFNFMGMAARLPDEASGKAVLEAAVNQGCELVELLRLHIFRENSIIFPLAHRLIDAETLQSMGA